MPNEPRRTSRISLLHTLRLFDRLLKSCRLPVRPGLLYEGPQLRFVNVLPLCECSLIGRRYCSALLCFVALHRLKPNVPELPICEQLRARNRQAGGISAAQESNRLLICSVFRIRHLIFGYYGSPQDSVIGVPEKLVAGFEDRTRRQCIYQAREFGVNQPLGDRRRSNSAEVELVCRIAHRCERG